jgi:hypothetical protein
MSNKKEKKKGCLYWLSRCFLDEETDEGHSQIHNEVILNNRNSFIREEIVDNSKQKMQIVEEKIKINTEIDKTNLHSNKAYDDTTKYNCPICLKYYSNILLLQCCKNQICIYCAEEYKSTQLKYEFNIKCPFCEYDKDMIINDAEINEPNKIYSDSPVCKQVARVEVKAPGSIITLQQ